MSYVVFIKSYGDVIIFYVGVSKSYVGFFFFISYVVTFISYIEVSSPT